MDSVREFNSEQWESGDPEVPISEVEKWLKSREDRSPKPEADGGSDSGSDSNADAGSKPDTTEGSGTDPDSSSDPS